MWDKRYDTEEYIYGTEPNDFLKANYATLPKPKILSLAEGEGRNAVFLAKQGFKVTAVDSSSIGLAKAKKLAEACGVEIECIEADLTQFDFGTARWDGIISIFCPLPSEIRRAAYLKMLSGLRTGGIFLTESYTPKQIEYGTGGGDCTDTMQSINTLKQELPSLEFNHLVEIEREVIEGTYHTGLASVVQAIGKKVS